ncbi:hypothetical protein [Fusobacterium gastrosuis]|uniref:hypothetical protein n=1 Tax=Fusobacterium gastrosuis TaxID=1755100 RepID=UPI002976418A|nr:tape measure protein [Fusobacteriaceae bacterium]MDY5712366.1 hypothetical protein [Fusobacterium gastrosuis]
MLEQLAVSFKVFGAEKFEKIKTQLNEIKEKTSSPFKTLVNIKTSGQEKLNKLKEKINNIKAKVKAPFNVVLKTAGVEKALGTTKIGFKKFGDYATQQFDKAQKKANSFSGIIKRIVTALGAGLIVNTAIEGAGKIEQYRNTLETVLKDPKIAKQKLAWASRFSNKTPFETDEVVGGMTKLQSYGIEGDRVLKTTNRTYLEMIGDMASGMGKSFDQAIEAVADARTGELERLKEFGITKNMIAEFGKTQGIELFNNKGQIKDMELFNKALFELMNSRFGGAMEKQAKTFKGGLSTIKGAFKSALSTLAGVNEFGDIVENSPFQILKDKVILPIANWLVKKQEDGTFTKWGEKLSEKFSKIINFGEKVIKFLIKWKEVLIPLASALAGLYAINKIIVLIGALKKGIGLITMGFSPWMLVIGGVIALGVLLYRNWDKIIEKINQLWDKIKAFSKGLWEFGKKIFFTFTPLGILIRIGKSIIDNWDLIKAKFTDVGNYIYTKIQDIGTFFINLKNKTVEVFFNLIEILKGVWDTLKNTVASAFNFVLDYVEKIWDKIKNFFGNLGDKIKNLPMINILFKAENEESNSESVIDGSHKAGLKRVPFDGYIAELHEGERVLTKEENKNYSNTNNSNTLNRITNVNVAKNSQRNNRKYELHIHVGSISTEVDWNKVADLIVEKIEENEIQKEIAGGGI